MITVLDQPTRILPAFNDTFFVVSSDKTAQSNFKYICDVYVSGVTSPAYYRLKANANPDNTYGYFNVSDVISSYVSYQLNIGNNAGFTRCENMQIGYTCKFGEEYGLSSTGTTVYADLTTTTRYAWNGSMDYLDFIDYEADQLTYLLGSSSRKFLTGQPSEFKIRSTELRWLYMIGYSSGGNLVSHMHIDVDDGSTLTPFEVINPFATVPSGKYEVMSFPCGVVNLKQIDNSFFTTGSAATLSTALDNATASNNGVITIYTKDALGNQSSEIKYLLLDDKTCTNHDVYTLHWLGGLGGINTFSFIRASQKTTTVQKVEYKKDARTYGSTMSWSKQALNKSNLMTKYNERIRITSDWIDDDTSTFLESLVSAPVVFYQYNSTTLIPVKIIQDSYTTSKKITDGAFNVSFDIEFMHDNYKQIL